MNNLKIATFCVAVSLLTACTSNSTIQATEVTTEETSYVETVSSTTQETTKTQKTTATETTKATETATETTETTAEAVETNITANIVESLIGTLDNKTQVASYEQNGALLTAYIDNEFNSYVVYISNTGAAELLYSEPQIMGYVVVEAYVAENFVPYQQFKNTIYVVTGGFIGTGQSIQTWHLTPDGTLIDLADTIDFEVENPGLYVTGTMVDGVEKTVIGLREQIPGTEAIGASQVVPVTLENEKIVKVPDVEPITG